MAAVTQRIPNFLGGVSRQPDDKKLPGQVVESINALPDVALGLTKRPGIQFISSLGSGTTYDNSKWFYIHRDNDEQYVGCITPASGNTTGYIYIWNAVSGVACTVESTSIEVTADGTGGGTANGTDIATTTSGSGTNLTVDLEITDGVASKVTINNQGSGYVTGDTITIAAADAGTTDDVVGTFTNAADYLTGSRTDYDILTVQDTSIITNKTIEVGTQTATTHTDDLKATILLNDIAYSAEYKVEITVGGTTYTASFTSPPNASGYPNGHSRMPNYDADHGLTAGDVLDAIEYELGQATIPNLTITKLDTVIELSNTDAMTVHATGGAATNKISSFVETVDNVSELANTAEHGRVVKIVNTTSPLDTYYAKFVAYDGVSGKGYWEETLGFNTSPGLDNTTMPHELVNPSVNNFTFRKVNYIDRLVGDDDTNSHPSFVGNTIQQAFLHSNRLGFLTADNVSMSQAGDFYNFYHISAQTVIDSDPVDISCSSIRPAVLHGIVSTTQGLVLFSRNQQFLMTAIDNILTPRTVSIRTISAYEMDTQVDPVDVGTNINFISKTSSFTRVFSMVTRGQQDNPQVLDLSKIVNEYIPSNVDTLIASPQNQFISMSSQASNKMFLFSFYNNGEKNLLESWYSWQMPGTVQTCAVDQDNMYVVTKQGTEFTLGKATLSQSPDSAIIVNSNGARVNPSVDLYTVASSVVYDSANELSKCYLPYSDVPGLKPVLLIAGSTAQGSFVESGFNTTPGRGSDGTGDYFSVPQKDLTSQASDVIVGFRYDFDVELPTTFYSRTPDGKTVDFSARLTIARYVFSLGLSGLMSFKVKAKGRDEWYELQPVAQADYYLANDIPLVDEQYVTLPIHQQNKNFTLRLFNDSPFPVSVGSMMWEGNYSPRYYRRT